VHILCGYKINSAFSVYLDLVPSDFSSSAMVHVSVAVFALVILLSAIMDLKILDFFVGAQTNVPIDLPVNFTIKKIIFGQLNNHLSTQMKFTRD